jgi:glycosyltransferase involved in cell wall biosynthesis
MKTTDNNVRISVVIPVYNAEDHIEDTINSVLNQTEKNVEIIVVDDGSTDTSPMKLEHYKETIKKVRIVNSGGPSKPRNVGIKNSTSSYISFFDADDIMFPDKLDYSIKYLERFKKAGLLCSEFSSINPKGNRIKEKYLKDYTEFRASLIPTEIDNLYVLPAERAYYHLLRANFIGTSSVACPRKVLEEVGGFDESMKNADDIDMWRRITKAGYDILFVDEPLHGYRIGLDSISARGGLSRFPAMIKGLEKEMKSLQSSEDIKIVSLRLSNLYQDFGWVLRKNMKFTEAIKAYKKSLNYKKSLKNFKGLVLALLKR